jgi:hypothetical protein
MEHVWDRYIRTHERKTTSENQSLPGVPAFMGAVSSENIKTKLGLSKSA